MGQVATGFSNGAFLLEHSVRLGSGLWAAVAPFGGHSYLNQSSGSSEPPLPILLGHAVRPSETKHTISTSTRTTSTLATRAFLTNKARPALD
jgi:poly(3-hydroxybutyrate) depolymerase